MDELKHLAKVRVAGSNPVFRSKLPGGGALFNPSSDLPRFRFFQSPAHNCRGVLSLARDSSAVAHVEVETRPDREL